MALWVFVFFLYGAALTLVHMFRTADIHEVLPPVIATLLTLRQALGR
ncbi:hypothetical protein [Actinomadura darangshiensis]|nr:hypothetical protein [Actinomadura darangshiensis]